MTDSFINRLLLGKNIDYTWKKLVENGFDQQENQFPTAGIIRSVNYDVQTTSAVESYKHFICHFSRFSRFTHRLFSDKHFSWSYHNQMNDNSVFAVYKLVLLKLNMFAIIYIIFFVGKFPIFEKQKPNLLIGIIIIIMKLNIEHSERVIESPSETISHLLVSRFPQQH